MDRFRHTHILGASGTGKTTLLVNTALDDIGRGEGICFLDPHGDAIDDILARIPKRRAKDVILFDPSDYEWPVAWNPLSTIPQESRAFVASSILTSAKAIWEYTIPTPVLDEVLYASTAALLDTPGGTLLGMKFLLTSPKYRKHVRSYIKDPIVKDFWGDFENLPEKDKREMTRSTLNKIRYLLADPHVRNTIGQKKSAFVLEKVMSDSKMLLVRLPQGRLGLEKTRMLGALLLSQVHTTALRRTGRTPFHVFIDECHDFATPTLYEMLSGIRKFGVSLTLANQYLDQLPRKLLSAILGNVGTRIIFRVGIEDSERLHRTIPHDNTEPMLHELAQYEARIFTGSSMSRNVYPPLPGGFNAESARKIANKSRISYASPRADVEAKIDKMLGRMKCG